MTTRRLIIDTDTAQDDCVAIMLGVWDQTAKLEAITMVAGNIDFNTQVRNAFLTLNVAGALGRVPVYLGCARPMMRPWVAAENVHGDGVGGLDMDLTDCEPEPEHAVDALIRLTAEAPGEIDIVAIGPLTNIAMAAVKEPSFASNVRSLVIMGGSNNGRGNITAAAEFNFYVDPEAAQTVFDAGFNITVVPWAPLMLNDAVFTRDRLEEIGRIDTPSAKYFLRISAATLAFDESVGIPGSTHPDSLSVAVLLHPELVQAQAWYNVQIETASELTRGYSAMSWGVHGLAPNATVVEQADGEAFFQLIKAMLAADLETERPVLGDL